MQYSDYVRTINKNKPDKKVLFNRYIINKI